MAMRKRTSTLNEDHEHEDEEGETEEEEEAQEKPTAQRAQANPTDAASHRPKYESTCGACEWVHGGDGVNGGVCGSGGDGDVVGTWMKMKKKLMMKKILKM